MTGTFTSFNGHRFDSAPTQNSDHLLTSGAIYEAMQGLSPGGGSVEVDAVPTQNSNNPVKSGGVYTALAGKQDKLTFDNSPTANSNNPVSSGGVHTALAGKQDKLTFDSAPASGSNNPVSSGGVYTALAAKQNDLTQVPTVTSLRETDYLFLERNGTLYKIRASAIIIPSADEDPGAIQTQSGEQLLTEDGEVIAIDEG